MEKHGERKRKEVRKGSVLSSLGDIFGDSTHDASSDYVDEWDTNGWAEQKTALPRTHTTQLRCAITDCKDPDNLDHVWQCPLCYACTHLSCVQASVDQQRRTRATLRLDAERWSCPLCQQYMPKGVRRPHVAVCFCGKVESPSERPLRGEFRSPHACGQKCDRLLSSLGVRCGHRCVELCHAGPCAPCPRMALISCHCGGQEAMRRCVSGPFSCGDPCDRVLECDHRCVHPCHSGPCPPCKQVARKEWRCHCGKSSRANVSCADWLGQGKRWGCGQPCGRVLTSSCGVHRCQLPCHDGPCDPCPQWEAASRCPCGRTALHLLPGNSCPPTVEEGKAGAGCGAMCGKALSCGEHRCTRNCHAGSCESCMRPVVLTCTCGSTSKKGLCGVLKAAGTLQLRCKSKCKRTLECGRHECKKRCCPGKNAGRGDGRDCGPCQQKCQRSLNCRRHRCEEQCHAAVCDPCPRTVRVTCRCGQTAMQVPCALRRFYVDGGNATQSVAWNAMLARGVEGDRSYLSVPCSQPCTLVSCQHKPHGDSGSHHNCHFGPCPPCQHLCGRLPRYVPTATLQVLPKPGASTKLAASTVLSPAAHIPCTHPCQDQCHDVIRNSQELRSFRAEIAAVAKRHVDWSVAGLLANVSLEVTAARLLLDGHERLPVTLSRFCGPCQQSVEVQCWGDHRTLQLRCWQVNQDRDVYPRAWLDDHGGYFPRKSMTQLIGRSDSSSTNSQVQKKQQQTKQTKPVKRDPSSEEVQGGGGELRTQREDPCSCGQACGLMLLCGKHRCARPCHPRSAGGHHTGVGMRSFVSGCTQCTRMCEVPRAQWTGRVITSSTGVLYRFPAVHTDKQADSGVVSVCEHICRHVGKGLRDESKHGVGRCHSGPCPPCRQDVYLRCACGKTRSDPVWCGQVFASQPAKAPTGTAGSQGWHWAVNADSLSNWKQLGAQTGNVWAAARVQNALSAVLSCQERCARRFTNPHVFPAVSDLCQRSKAGADCYANALRAARSAFLLRKFCGHSCAEACETHSRSRSEEGSGPVCHRLPRNIRCTRKVHVTCHCRAEDPQADKQWSVQVPCYQLRVGLVHTMVWLYARRRGFSDCPAEFPESARLDAGNDTQVSDKETSDKKTASGTKDSDNQDAIDTASDKSPDSTLFPLLFCAGVRMRFHDALDGFADTDDPVLGFFSAMRSVLCEVMVQHELLSFSAAEARKRVKQGRARYPDVLGKCGESCDASANRTSRPTTKTRSKATCTPAQTAKSKAAGERKHPKRGSRPRSPASRPPASPSTGSVHRRSPRGSNLSPRGDMSPRHSKSGPRSPRSRQSSSPMPHNRPDQPLTVVVPATPKAKRSVAPCTPCRRSKRKSGNNSADMWDVDNLHRVLMGSNWAIARTIFALTLFTVALCWVLLQIL